MTEVPEHLLQRSRERRKALGLPVEGEEPETQAGGVGGDEGGPPPPAPPAPGSAGEEGAGGEEGSGNGEAQPQPAAGVPADGNGGDGSAYFAEMSSKTGVPAHLLERSARRRAQLTGEPMPGDGGGGAAPAAAPAGGAVAVATAVAPAPAIVGTGPGGHTHRLLTVVKAGSIQQTKASPVDKVHTWPHLLVFEFTALLAVTAVLTVFSALVRAPLLELADPNLTPNPSKAPWYFLGLQELLTMWHPMVAGVLIPGYGLLALAAAPYVDRNSATDPGDRKFAVSLFTVFLVAAAILAIIGSFFRGPGFNFTYPWVDGVFFDL